MLGRSSRSGTATAWSVRDGSGVTADGASARVVRAEIREFHEQLAVWLAEGSERTMQRLASAVARELSFVGLDGEALDRDELVAALADAGASRPGLRIAIEDLTVRELASGLWLATFVERQSPGRSRRTSAILRNETKAPLGVAWVHVHETPLG